MKTLFFSLSILAMSFNVLAQKNTFSYKIGEIEVVLLSEGQQGGNKSILIGATDKMMAEYAPSGTFPNAVNAFLVKTPKQNVLIDAGFGRELFNNLESVGVSAEQIDIVLLTHMHGDHIGGLLRNGEKAFPNAKLRLSDMEHDYWMSDEEMNNVSEGSRGSFQSARAVIEAYKEVMQLFTPVSVELEIGSASMLKGIAAYGHTPGHTAFMVESKGQKLFIWGDLTHAMALQMPHPSVAVTYDIDPEQAVTSRKKILKYISEKNIPVAGMHIAYPGIGTIESAGEGYKFIPVE